jgi:hypothetical protein
MRTVMIVAITQVLQQQMLSLVIMCAAFVACLVVDWRFSKKSLFQFLSRVVRANGEIDIFAAQIIDRRNKNYNCECHHSWDAGFRTDPFRTAVICLLHFFLHLLLVQRKSANRTNRVIRVLIHEVSVWIFESWVA